VEAIPAEDLVFNHQPRSQHADDCKGCPYSQYPSDVTSLLPATRRRDTDLFAVSGGV
jgi:hypothetical protein